jgi:hypothetical protein
LDPDEVGWDKIIHSVIVARKGIAQDVDGEKLLKAVEAEVKDRTKELDKFLEKKRMSS